jgi:hypothetical protein
MKKQHLQKGNSLVMLLVFAVVATTVAAAAVAVMINVSQGTSRLEGRILASQVAESGMENALLRLLRNPNYVGETNLQVGNGTVDITVTGDATTKTITSIGRINNYLQTVQVIVTYNDTIMTISSWKESYN